MAGVLILSSLFSQVRLQTQPKPKPGESLIYAGTIDCFKKTLAKEVRMHVVVSLEYILDKTLFKMSFLPRADVSSLPSSLTGCERTLQRHGSSHHWSHTHVCRLFLWIRTGQETTAEDS